MINEHQNSLNPSRIREEMRNVANSITPEQIGQLTTLFQLYHSGMNEFGTKLENLDAEFHTRYDYNPIHHMEARMKDVASLFNKMKKKGIPFQKDAMQQDIFDIAGIRVITNYIDDIEAIEDNLLKQDDVTLIRRKDYVNNPKDSGYRSLHLILSVPVFQTDGPYEVPVEIQIRTIGMDMWASLEHKLKYKTNSDPNMIAKYSNDLIGYAEELTQIEQNMQIIHKDIR
ncbi:GTP pyrophosphokinase [Paucilactobacillus nenjiangensis]|uniref:GTP pyrophosphokinase n=1 Tax=Paucilactobacillus nenjiangensis TaxID=1296540 RepID=UPI003BB4E2BB